MAQATKFQIGMRVQLKSDPTGEIYKKGIIRSWINPSDEDPQGYWSVDFERTDDYQSENLWLLEEEIFIPA